MEAQIIGVLSDGEKTTKDRETERPLHTRFWRQTRVSRNNVPLIFKLFRFVAPKMSSVVSHTERGNVRCSREKIHYRNIHYIHKRGTDSRRGLCCEACVGIKAVVCTNFLSAIDVGSP